MKKEDHIGFFNFRKDKVNSGLIFLMIIIILPVFFNILPRNICNNTFFKQGIVLKRIKTSHYTTKWGVINQ